MTKEWRTLKLEILAETKQFLDDLKKSEKQTQSFGDKMAEFGKKAALAMAAFGSAAVAAGVQFAKAAAEDEQAANRLSATLKATTRATNAQIAAVEQYVLKTSLATGITDDQLRPAFERLARSTKSVNEAQDLLNLSLDLAAATGKPLESVTNALAKAYDGSYTSLNRLGLGIDQNAIKAKDFKGIYDQLNSTFGEFSENRSQEAIVKFQRLQVAVQEAKEQIGAALLPIMVRLGDWLIQVGVPNLQAFIDGLTGQRGVTVAISEANKGAYQFGERLKKIFETIYTLKEEFAALAGVIASLWVVAKIAAFVQGITTLVKAFQAWRAAAAGAAIATAAATGGVSAGAALAGAAAVAAGLGLALSQFKSNGESDFTDGGIGLGNRPLGGMGGIFGGGGGGISLFGGGGGGTSSRSLSDISGGLVTSPEDLASKLTSTSNRISEIQFLYETKQISRNKAQEMLEAAKKDFAKLQAISQQFATQNQTQRPMGAFGRGEYGGITINVNAPSVIDETGFTRAIIDALNSIERRQGGGASALVGL